MMEAEILKGLDHPRIPKLLNSFVKGDTTYMVMEYKKGLTLDRAVACRNFSEADIRYIMKQLTSIVDYLHTAAKVIHRDIKPQNILIDDHDNVSLIDFGFADYITPNMTARFGTPAYCSPELVRGIPYSELTDVWSLGVVAYSLMAESLPFQGSSIEEVFKSIVMDDPIISTRFSRPVSPNFINFVRSALTKEPSFRGTSQSLAQHPWLCASEIKTTMLRHTSGSTGSVCPRVPLRKGAVIKPRLSASIMNLSKPI